MTFASAVSIAESVEEANYHCPLNAAYLLQQLSAMEALPLYPSSEQVTPLKQHSTRMTVEELKNKDLIPRESCDYFKIGLRLEELEKGSKEFPKRFASYNIAELLTEAEKCGKWISENFQDKESPIESYYCR